MMFTPCPNSPPCPHGGMVHDIEDLEDRVPLCCIEGCYCGHAANCQMRVSPPAGFPFSCFSCNCRGGMETMTGMYADNDGQFPDESSVKVRYPVTGEQQDGDRNGWPWLPGTVLGQCGPDEWHVVVDGVEELGEPDPDDPDEVLYPACFRDSSEIRRQVSDSEEGRRP